MYWVGELARSEQRSVGEPELNNYFCPALGPSQLILSFLLPARPPPKLKISKYLIIWFLFGIFSGKWHFYNINLLFSDFDWNRNYDDEQAKNIIAQLEVSKINHIHKIIKSTVLKCTTDYKLRPLVSK